MNMSMETTPYYTSYVDLHRPNHLARASGSHWGKTQLQAFKVEHVKLSGRSSAQIRGNLPSIHNEVERFRVLLTSNNFTTLDREEYAQLRSFVQSSRWRRDGHHPVHPLDILREGELGAQFFHDLAVATAPTRYVDIDSTNGDSDDEPEAPTARPQRSITQGVRYNHLYEPASESETPHKSALQRQQLLLDSSPFVGVQVGSGSMYQPSGRMYQASPSDFDVSPDVKPETLTRALAKSFIETILVFRPVKDMQPEEDCRTRLSFVVAEHPFNVVLPAVRFNASNDGGIVYTTTHREKGPIPSWRVLLSLETKAKRSGEGALKDKEEVLAQQCAELIGQALSDPSLRKSHSENRIYYLVSLNHCEMSFLSAAFTPAYVDYLFSTCPRCPPAGRVPPPRLDAGSSTPASPSVLSSSPPHRTASLATSPIAKPHRENLKRGHSDLTDEESDRSNRDIDRTEGDVDHDSTRLRITQSQPFDLNSIEGRVGAMAHLLALFDEFEGETGCRF